MIFAKLRELIKKTDRATFCKFDESGMFYEDYRRFSLVIGALDLAVANIRHSCTCPRSVCVRKVLSQSEWEAGCMCGADEALAAIKEMGKE